MCTGLSDSCLQRFSLLGSTGSIGAHERAACVHRTACLCKSPGCDGSSKTFSFQRGFDSDIKRCCLTEAGLMQLRCAGRQTLDIVAEHSERFQVVALSAGSNLELLAEQIRAVKPKLVAIKCACVAILPSQPCDAAAAPVLSCCHCPWDNLVSQAASTGLTSSLEHSTLARQVVHVQSPRCDSGDFGHA